MTAEGVQPFTIKKKVKRKSGWSKELKKNPFLTCNQAVMYHTSIHKRYYTESESCSHMSLHFVTLYWLYNYLFKVIKTVNDNESDSPYNSRIKGEIIKILLNFLKLFSYLL